MCRRAGVLGFEKAVGFSIGKICGGMGTTEVAGGDGGVSPLPRLPQCSGKKGQVCTHCSGFGGGSLPEKLGCLPGAGDPMQCKSFLQGAICTLQTRSFCGGMC